MQKSDTVPQAQDKKQDWADVEGEEEEVPTQSQTASQSKGPQSQAKKAEKKKKKKPTQPQQRDPNLVNNVFVCDELDADDDYDEEETAPKKEKVKESGPSLRDLIASTEGKGEKEEKVLSKKDQKKKELEDLDKLLSEMGLKNENAGKTEEPPKEQPKEETKAAEGDNHEKKKKKKKAEKTEAPQEATSTQPTTTQPQESQPSESTEGTHVDPEKRIQEVLKKKAAAQAAQKKQATALDVAKQEILARSTNAKKPNKKDYDL